MNFVCYYYYWMKIHRGCLHVIRALMIGSVQIVEMVGSVEILWVYVVFVTFVHKVLFVVMEIEILFLALIYVVMVEEIEIWKWSGIVVVEMRIAHNH